MRKTVRSVLVCGGLVVVASVAGAAGPRPVAQPFDGGVALGEPSYAIDWTIDGVITDHLVLGADHISDQQCANGGFGWPHDDCSAT